MAKKFSHISELACPKCGSKYNPMEIQTLCSCGTPLVASYDLEAAKETLTKESLKNRALTMWRYHELLPVADGKNITTLGEGMTPLLKSERMGDKLGLKNLMVKDEGMNPTGTFKARGSSSGVSKAKELGIEAITIPTNGNAGAAWATYTARAGMDAYVIMPANGPSIAKREIVSAGANLYLVNGTIHDAGVLADKLAEDYGIFNVATLKEPYRLEGKKTMGLEIMEQLNWEAPDVVVYPTGGGVGLIGINKGIHELEEMGLSNGNGTRMVSVQASGCAPIVKAFEEGREESELWENSDTVAFGMKVPKSLGDFLVLDALRSTNGTALEVTDEELLETKMQMGRNEGIFMCPEGASTIAAVKKLVESGEIDRDEKVVVINTGSGLKYPNLVEVNPPVYEKGQEITLESLKEAKQ